MSSIPRKINSLLWSPLLARMRGEEPQGDSGPVLDAEEKCERVFVATAIEMLNRGAPIICERNDYPMIKGAVKAYAAQLIALVIRNFDC